MFIAVLRLSRKTAINFNKLVLNVKKIRLGGLQRSRGLTPISHVL